MANDKYFRGKEAYKTRVLEMAEDRVEESIAKLKPKELIDMCVTLQEFVRPKLQRVNMEVETESTKLTKIIFEVVGEGEVRVCVRVCVGVCA